jgi:hypothetical protein
LVYSALLEWLRQPQCLGRGHTEINRIGPHLNVDRPPSDSWSLSGCDIRWTL